jgi:chaperonin GroEL (HSP60 family)
MPLEKMTEMANLIAQLSIHTSCQQYHIFGDGTCTHTEVQIHSQGIKINMNCAKRLFRVKISNV